MNGGTLILYSTACLAIAATPGPTMLLALSNGMTGGLRRAAWGIVGACLGSATVIAVVALGLGSLLAASHWLFDALRVAGTLYLGWLGVRMWRAPVPDLRVALDDAPQYDAHRGLALVRSLAVALSNPKAVFFFAAFLPQFVDVRQPQAPQYAVLGGVFIGIDFLMMLAYAAAGTQAVRWMSQRSLRWLNRSCGAGMWLLAGVLALGRRPGA